MQLEARQSQELNAGEKAEVQKIMSQLISTWEDVQNVTVPLSLVVTPAVLTTGALRLAVVPKPVSNVNFPALSVMLYGLFFAMFVAAAVIPMVLSWRSRARELVDLMEPLPKDNKITEVIARRSSLEKFLQLDVGYLRSPITLLGILAPFVTAAVTALIPTGK
jgi:uncharacterized protein YpmS